MDIRSFFKKPPPAAGAKPDPVSCPKGMGEDTAGGPDPPEEKEEKENEEEEVLVEETREVKRARPDAARPKGRSARVATVVLEESSDDEGDREANGKDAKWTPSTPQSAGKKRKPVAASPKKPSSAKKKAPESKYAAVIQATAASLPDEGDAGLAFTVRPVSAELNPFNQGGPSEDNPPNRGKKSAPPAGADDCFAGMTFVVSGTLDSLLRGEAEDLIKRHGGRVTGAVSGRTSFLLAGTDCGATKVKAAREKGTKIVDEDGLFKLLLCTASEARERKREGREGDKAKQADERKAHQAASSGTSGRKAEAGGPRGADASRLWVDKHKPQTTQDVVGNGSNTRLLSQWLRDWHMVHTHGGLPHPVASVRGREPEMGRKAVLLSGPPGVGKTTSANLFTRHWGYAPVEVNASDARGKADRDRNKGISGKLSNQVREMVCNRSLRHLGTAAGGAKVFAPLTVGGGGGSGGRTPKATEDEEVKPLVIMDEVDGMSGSDRGGIAELVELIKRTKIPIICICNDKFNPKMKPLRNVCLEVDFRRPSKQEIAKRMLQVCEREGLKTNLVTLETLAEASNGDLRILLGHLQNFRLTREQLTYDDVKASAASAKDADLSPFAAAQILLGYEAKGMPLSKQMDLVFQDADLIPLLIQENYVNHRPAVCGNHLQRMRILAKAADAFSCGDIVNNQVRGHGEWSLMPFGALVGSVYPSTYVRGSREVFGLYPGEANMARFTAWLGSNSSHGKQRRLLSEVHGHMQCSQNCLANATSVLMEYLGVLRKKLVGPLATLGKDGIQEVVDTMDDYCLSRDDFDSVFDLTKYKSKGAQDPTKSIPTAVKTAFTRKFNASEHRLVSGLQGVDPFVGKSKAKAKGKRKAKADDDLEEELGSDGEGQQEQVKISARKLEAMNFVPKNPGVGPAASKKKAKPGAAKKKAKKN